MVEGIQESLAKISALVSDTLSQCEELCSDMEDDEDYDDTDIKQAMDDACDNVNQLADALTNALNELN